MLDAVFWAFTPLDQTYFLREYEHENCYNIRYMDDKIRSRKLLSTVPGITKTGPKNY